MDDRGRLPTPIEVGRETGKERELPRLWPPVIPGVTGSDIAILRALAESRTGPLTVSELAEEVDYSQRTVYRRVKELKMNEGEREGGLLSEEGESGGIWFKSMEIAEQVGEYFAMMEDYHPDG
jgi:DNA-binding transcriptional ArsR family regulator